MKRNFLEKIVRFAINNLYFFYSNLRISQGKFHLPRSLIWSKEEIATIYPDIFSFYPKINFYKEIQKRKGKLENAAVVFNSSKILEHERGIKIDNADVVVRVNFLPTLGFEKYVGSKTDIRVLGRDWIFQEKDELMIHTYNSRDFLKSDLQNYKNSRILRDNGIYLTKHELIDQTFSRYLNGMMTNGFRAVIIALALCNHVTIFGSEKTLENHNRGKNISHFPGKNELNYIKEKMADWNLTQDFERYFNPITANTLSGKFVHNTIKREYTFYRLCPQIHFAD